MPSQRPSASRSRKSLFNVKTLQYAGSLNCVLFQNVEGKTGNPSHVQKGPRFMAETESSPSSPSHAAGTKPGGPFGFGQGWSPSHTVRTCPVRPRPGCTELEFPTRGKGTPGSRTAGGLYSPLPTCQRHTGCLGAILPYLARLLTCQGRAGTCGRKAQSLPHSVPRAHKATPVHGKPPPLWVQGPKTGEKKGGKPGKRARPPTVSRLYTTDGVFFSPCTERSVLQCS